MHVVFCPNKLRSFEPFTCLYLGFASQQVQQVSGSSVKSFTKLPEAVHYLSDILRYITIDEY